MSKHRLYGAVGVDNFLTEQEVSRDGFSEITPTQENNGGITITAKSGESNFEFYFLPITESMSECVEIIIDKQRFGRRGIQYILTRKLFEDAERLGVCGKSNLVVYTKNTQGKIVTTVKNILDYENRKT